MYRYSNCNLPYINATCNFVLLQMLEYTGRGKSIIDVGLAQARYPLDTTNHYFEIEIVDPGENCYIAIGLAKRVSNFNEMHSLPNFS